MTDEELRKRLAAIGEREDRETAAEVTGMGILAAYVAVKAIGLGMQKETFLAMMGMGFESARVQVSDVLKAKP